MIVLNKNMDHDYHDLLAAFFTRFPNPRLQVEVDHALKRLFSCKILMPGKPGGWAGGIIYALANQGRRACGVPNLLNKEFEEFFDVSMGTIYKRAWQIRKLLVQ